MKLPQTLFFLLTLITTIHALAIPEAFESFAESSKLLFKRKGGGGGSRGGSSSSTSSSSGSRSGSSGSTSSGNGGTRVGGVGPQPKSFAGGAYYGGGATTPYRSGRSSPGGISPLFLGAGALAFFPGIWLYGAYAYNYNDDYTYHNNTSGQNETHPVECLCSRYEDCGCDSRNESDYVNSVANNASIARLADVNGQEKLVINGTLPNGTTVATGAAGSSRQGLLEMSGYWMVIAGVIYTVWLF